MKYVICMLILLFLSGCYQTPSKVCWERTEGKDVFKCEGTVLMIKRTLVDAEYQVEYECNQANPHIMTYPSPHFLKGVGWVDARDVYECK